MSVINKDVLDEKIYRESQIINLLLKHKSAINDFIDSGFSYECFSKKHHPIVIAIIEAYEKNGVLLTREAFELYKKKFSSTHQKIQLDVAFTRCNSAAAKLDNFPMLLEQLVEDQVHHNLSQSVSKCTNGIKEGQSVIEVVKTLRDDCEEILSGAIRNKKEGEYFYGSMSSLTRGRIEYIEKIRRGEIEEDPIILTGIKEIDETMVTGLEKGTLTMFCADVGGFKSAMMLNVGLNVWESGHNVLFVPLEMHRDQIWRRMCARQTRIDSKILTRGLKNMTDEQLAKIYEMEKKEQERVQQFYIMEKPGRTTVPIIEREIKKHIDIFQPRLVVVDYVANLQSHIDRRGRNDLEIGDMLKEMREMGKELNFAVISAAQLGREALKRLRKTGANKDKPTINSEDIRGSHEYSADADNIYAMMRNSQQPGSRLHLFCVKARNGTTYFGGDNEKVRASLHVLPQYGLIYSPDDVKSDIDEEQLEQIRAETEAHSEEIVRKKEDDESFFDEDKAWSDFMGQSSKTDKEEEEEVTSFTDSTDAISETEAFSAIEEIDDDDEFDFS